MEITTSDHTSEYPGNQPAFSFVTRGTKQHSEPPFLTKAPHRGKPRCKDHCLLLSLYKEIQRNTVEKQALNNKFYCCCICFCAGLQDCNLNWDLLCCWSL